MDDRDNQFPTGPMELPGAPEPNQATPPDGKQPRFSKKRLLLVIIGLFILAGIGFAAAIITEPKQNSEAPAQSNQTNQQPTSNPVVDDVPSTTITKTHKSDFPRVEFTYPETWTVTEDKEQEGIRITSPEFNYMTINGGTVKGHFRIYIRQGARQVDSKYIGRGIAAQPSEPLIYTEPAPSQRTETNLSLFGLDTSDNFAFFMIAGNFNLQKDEALGPEYGREPDTYIIAGGYSSKELTEDLAMNQVSLEMFSQTNAYKQGLDILRSLKIL